MSIPHIKENEREKESIASLFGFCIAWRLSLLWSIVSTFMQQTQFLFERLTLITLSCPIYVLFQKLFPKALIQFAYKQFFRFPCFFFSYLFYSLCNTSVFLSHGFYAMKWQKTNFLIYEKLTNGYKWLLQTSTSVLCILYCTEEGITLVHTHMPLLRNVPFLARWFWVYSIFCKKFSFKRFFFIQAGHLQRKFTEWGIKMRCNNISSGGFWTY